MSLRIKVVAAISKAGLPVREHLILCAPCPSALLMNSLASVVLWKGKRPIVLAAASFAPAS